MTGSERGGILAALALVLVAAGCGSSTAKHEDAAPEAVDAGPEVSAPDAVDAKVDAPAETPAAEVAAPDAVPDTVDAPEERAEVIDDAPVEQEAGTVDVAPDLEVGPGCDAGVDAAEAGGWQLLGPALRAASTGYAFEPTLALADGDQPVVAWSENGMVQTQAWQETGCGAWTSLGAVAGFSPVIASGAQGVLRAYVTAQTSGHVVVERWTGHSFVAVGEPLGATLGKTDFPVLVADAAGNPVVAWLTLSGVQVARWDGAHWTSLTDAAGVPPSIVDGGISTPLSITLAADGTPIVAWPGQAHATVVARFVSGTTWETVGTPPPSNDGSGANNGPVIRVNAAGTAFLAWIYKATASPFRVSAARLDGTSWTTLGGPLMAGAAASDFSISFEGDGTPLVTTMEYDSTAAASRVFFYRWSGTAWTTPAPSLPDLAGTDARRPHLEVDTRGQWVVAWAELASTSMAVVRVARRQP